MPKGCAHIASTESTECPEPRNQGGVIGYPIREIWGEMTRIHLHMFNQCHIFKNEQLERPNFNTIYT